MEANLNKAVIFRIEDLKELFEDRHKIDRKEGYPLILDVNDICKILRVSKPTAYEVMNQKGFPVIQNVGRDKKVYRDSFFEWLDKQESVS